MEAKDSLGDNARYGSHRANLSRLTEQRRNPSNTDHAAMNAPDRYDQSWLFQ